MFLRPFFAKPFASTAFFLFVCLGGAGYFGCSSGDAHLACDDTGNNCFWCDANGCKPADPSVNSASSSSSGMGGAGGSSTTSSSSSSSGKPPCDSSNTTCGCTKPEDCPSNLSCIDGLCIVGCNNSFECGAGKVCVNGQCEVGCNDQKPCPTGSMCTKGFCAPDPAKPQCTLEIMCPSGQTCVNGICEKSCTQNTDCPLGEVCNDSTGGCMPTPFPSPSCGPDKPCSGTAQCGMAGYCQFPCLDVTACKLIDSRFSACDQGICKTPEEMNPQCSLQKPCPAGQDCVSNQCK